MRRSIVALALVVLAAPAGAQTAENPHGGMARSGPVVAEPELSTDLEVGTVEVFVSRDQDRPEVSVAVSLAAEDGASKTARTDGAGRVIFAGIEGGTRYTVSATVDGKRLTSAAFAMPGQGGVRVELSPQAEAPPMGGGMSGGMGGRPDPRQMSGIPRPEAKDPAGVLTIRPLQGPLEESEFGGLEADIPVGALVHLVGLDADGNMTVDSKTVSKEDGGRVRFTGLDRQGKVAYYALSMFRRSAGIDRLMSQTITMPPEVGVRLMLAGNDPSSAAGSVDDFQKHFGGGGEGLPPGQIRVRLVAADGQEAVAGTVKTIKLHRMSGDGKPLEGRVEKREPGPEEIFGQGIQIQPRGAAAPGEVSVFVVRPTGEEPIAGVEVTLRRAGDDTAEPTVKKTGADGLALFDGLEEGAEYTLSATTRGKTVTGDPIRVSKDSGIGFAFAFDWPVQELREAVFDGVEASEDDVFIAVARGGGRDLLSPPFQLPPDRGAAVPILVYPELLFRFHGGAQLDDERLWFQLNIAIANPSVRPVRQDSAGVHIPLPDGFLAASVAEEMQARVKIESDKGFLWRGAFPPGQRDFIASFAMPVTDGSSTIDLPLPFGLTGGSLMLEDFPGAKIAFGASADRKRKEMDNGRMFIEFSNIEVEQGGMLSLTVTDLPQHPPWRKKVKLAVGALVIVLLAWILYGVARAVRPSQDLSARYALERERDQLLDEMVQLELDRRAERASKKSYTKRKQKIQRRLEEIYADLDGDGERTAAAT